MSELTNREITEIYNETAGPQLLQGVDPDVLEGLGYKSPKLYVPEKELFPVELELGFYPRSRWEKTIAVYGLRKAMNNISQKANKAFTDLCQDVLRFKHNAGYTLQRLEEGEKSLNEPASPLAYEIGEFLVFKALHSNEPIRYPVALKKKKILATVRSLDFDDTEKLSSIFNEAQVDATNRFKFWQDQVEKNKDNPRATILR